MTKDIVKKLVRKRASNGTVYTQTEVESIVTSQFRYLTKVITGGDFSSVRVRYLGVFYVKPKRLQQFNADRVVRYSNLTRYRNGTP